MAHISWSDDGDEITFDSLAAAYGLIDDERTQPAADAAHLPFTAPSTVTDRRIQPSDFLHARKAAPLDYFDDRARPFQLEPVQTTRGYSHADELMHAGSSPSPAFLTVHPGRDPNRVALPPTDAFSRQVIPSAIRGAKPAVRRSEPRQIRRLV